MSDLRIAIIARLVNKVRGPAREVRADLEQIGAASDRTAAQAGRAARAQERFGAVTRLASRAAMAGVVTAGAGVTASIKSAVQMQDAWSEANKTLALAPEPLAELRAEVAKLAVEIPLANGSMVDIVATAGQLGIRGQQAILEFTRDTAKMAATFDVSAGRAAEMQASWREQMRFTQDEVRMTADQINWLGNNTAAQSAQVAEFYTGIANIANEAGMAREEVLALGAAMIASGRAPEVAVTGLRGVFRTMGKGWQDLSDREAGMATKLGLQGERWNALQRQMATDSAGAIRTVVSAISELPQHERNVAAGVLFGEEAQRAMGALLVNAEFLEEALSRIPQLQGAAGSMNEEYLALSDDVLDNWRRLKEALSQRLAKAGAGFLGPINAGLKGLLRLLSDADDRVGVLERLGQVRMGLFDGLGIDGARATEGLRSLGRAVRDLVFGIASADPGESLARIYQRARDFGERIAPVTSAISDAVVSVAEAWGRLGGAALDGIAASLEPAQANLQAAWDRVGPILDNIRATFSAFVDLGRSDALAAGLETIGAGLGTLAGLAGRAATGSFLVVAEGIKALTAAVASVANGEFGAAKATLQDFATWWGERVFKPLDLSNILPDRIANIAVIETASLTLSKLWSTLSDLRASAATGIATGLGAALDGIAASLEPAQANLQAAWDRVGPILDNIRDSLASLGSIFDGKQAGFGSVAEGFGSALGQIAGVAAQLATGAIERAAHAIETLTSALSSVLSGDFGGAISKITSWFDALAATPVPRFEFSGLVPTEAQNSALATLLGLVGDLVDLGHAIAKLSFEGIASAIRSAFDGLSEHIEPIMARLKATGNQVAPILDNLRRIVQAITDLFRTPEVAEQNRSGMAAFGSFLGEIAGLTARIAVTALEAVARAIETVTGVVAAILDGDFGAAWKELREFFDWLSALVVDGLNLGELFTWPDPPRWLRWLMGEEAPTALAVPDVTALPGFQQAKPEQQVAVQRVATALNEARLPTDARLDSLRADVAHFEAEVARVQQAIDVLGTGPLADTLAMPLKDELRLLQRDLDMATAALKAAETQSAALRSDLAVLGLTETEIRIDTSTLQRALELVGRLRTQTAALGGQSAPAGPSPRVQARAAGGSFNPGWLLTGEKGPELRFADRSGFVATNRQFREMVAASERLRRSARSWRPAIAPPVSRGARAPLGPITIHIHGGPGQDLRGIAREVRREMTQLMRGGGELHDGAAYD